MSASTLALLTEVRSAGGAVALDGDVLKVTAPEPLPAALIDRLRAAKPELLQVLGRVAAYEQIAKRGAAAYAVWLETADAGDGAS